MRNVHTNLTYHPTFIIAYLNFFVIFLRNSKTENLKHSKKFHKTYPEGRQTSLRCILVKLRLA